MKKGLIIIFLIAFSNSVWANEVIKVASGNWEPFNSKREKNANIAELLVDAAFKLEGIDTKYAYFPWKRSYSNVQKGKHDISFPWIKNEARQKDFLFNNVPLITEKTVFFHLKDLDFDWKDYNDLKKYKIGGTNGYASNKVLASNGINVDIVGTEELNYKKLLKGRIDLYPGAFFVGYYQINRLFGPAKSAMFTNHSKPMTVDDYYVLFNKNNPKSKEWIQKLDSGLRKLKTSGEYDRLVDQVLLKK